MRSLFLLALTFLVPACRNEPASPPPGALTRDQFVLAYASLLEARGARAASTTDTIVTRRAADSVLARLGTTREKFARTAQWYNMDVLRWRGCMEEVTRILEERQEKRGQRR